MHLPQQSSVFSEGACCGSSRLCTWRAICISCSVRRSASICSRHLFRERDAAHGDSRLAGNRCQQAFVAGGVRFFGKPGTEHGQSFERSSAGAANRHQALRVERSQLRASHLLRRSPPRAHPRSASSAIPAPAAESVRLPAADCPHTPATGHCWPGGRRISNADAAHPRCSAGEAMPALRGCWC